MIKWLRDWWWRREVKAIEEEKRQRHAYANEMVQEWRRAEWKRRAGNG
jgi:hypothetical protein